MSTKSVAFGDCPAYGILRPNKFYRAPQWASMFLYEQWIVPSEQGCVLHSMVTGITATSQGRFKGVVTKARALGSQFV